MSGFEDRRDAFVERLFTSSVAAMDVLCVYVGDRLGLYRALAETGPCTPARLADVAGVHERYAREWLEQQAASGILEVGDAGADPDARTFSLPPAHADALVDPESPYAMAAVCRSIVALGGGAPHVVDAFRTGGGVGWEAFGLDMIEAQGDFNRPWLLSSFGTEHLPSIPDVHERLTTGARVADVACGVGWAAIAIAEAYPNVEVHGFDLDETSIALAKANAEARGVAERVRFEARDGAADDLARGTYDLAVVVESIHDMSDPVGVLAAIRSMLKGDGTLIVADERTEDAFVAPASWNERFFYGYSVLTCLPSAMADQPSAATGTVMRRDTFERYAREAGFGSVEVLPIEHDFLRFYRVDP
ncbi:MAG TPA: class I SAM-dependent methyltransferase [Actinomycetota bacterium]|nr:class I SAM-dependent methyltransferase [Actinomycetota bacterium]